jgi:hypothetical protein
MTKFEKSRTDPVHASDYDGAPCHYVEVYDANGTRIFLSN